jgi:alkylation response protein AidB-like acyl-CoA dehydrogenase
MSNGFDLDLSPTQTTIQSYLHSIVPELRAGAANVETQGIDRKLLLRQLNEAGVAPATLLKNGVVAPHTLIIALEELAYGDADTAWAALASLQLVTVLSACGNPQQIQKAIPMFEGDPLANARVLLYEDFGRQPSEFNTQVDTSRGYQLVGRKTSVCHPATADISLLVARSEDDLEVYCFAGDRDGIAVARDDRAHGKVALTSVPTGCVTLDGVSLSADDKLESGIDLHRAVAQSRLLLAAIMIGLSRSSLEFCAAYATERKTWGQPIASYQGVSFPLVELTSELAEVRLLLWDVAGIIADLDDVAEIERHVSRAVNRAGSLALRATRDGVQLVGVRAISKDLPCERWYRQAAALAAIDFDVLQTPFGLS